MILFDVSKKKNYRLAANKQARIESADMLLYGCVIVYTCVTIQREYLGGGTILNGEQEMNEVNI